MVWSKSFLWTVTHPPTPKSCLNFNFQIELHLFPPRFPREFIRNPRGLLLHTLEFAEYIPEAGWGVMIEFQKKKKLLKVAGKKK